MTSLKISSLYIFLHLAVISDLVAGQEMTFILNSTKVEHRDMTCSINGRGDDSQIEGIVRIDIFGILEKSEERLATVNFFSPNSVKPGKDQILRSLGSISGKDGVLRLKMTTDKRFLQYACRAVVMDKDLNHITMEKHQINKDNVLMSMLNQRFAGIASGVDFNEAFQKLEDKVTDTRDNLADEIKMEIERSLNVTKEALTDAFGTVHENKDKTKDVIEKVSDIKVELTSAHEKIDTIYVLLETLVNQSTKNPGEFEAKSCEDFRNAPRPFRSRVTITTAEGTPMVCDTATKGGGWTVFQRRVNGDVNFNRNWNDYENGFGSLDSSFWMGLAPLSSLVATGTWELRVDIEYKGTMYYAEYRNFKMGDALTKYKLSISGFSGTAGDSLAIHNKMAFSTKDRDNDADGNLHCAEDRGGAWWFIDCEHSNLNGQWGSKETNDGVNWDKTTTNSDSATFTEMKVRRV